MVSAPVLPRPGFEQVAVLPPAVTSGVDSPFRKLAFYFSLAALFVRFGVLQEIIVYVTGFNSYILYLTALPAILLTLFSGGLRRTFLWRAPYWWMLFFGWMLIGIPFSYWPGGSVGLLLKVYGRTDLVFMLIAGGLATNWREVRALYYTVASAAVVNLITARLFMDSSNGRISLTASGTIGNSNDLAAHLLMMLPFLLFIAMDAKRNWFIRVPLLAAIGYGLYLVLATASRGALIALTAVFAYVLWRATPTQRVLALIGGALVSLIALTLLPHSTLDRLGNLFGERHYEAELSEEIRQYLFRQSLTFTFEHPLLGVGAGQFSNFEGNERLSEGERGLWKDTHCTLTQVSSEGGIPALILFLGGLFSAVLMVAKVYRKARERRDTEVSNLCLCYVISMIGFLTAISFLSFAYSFSLPALVGIAGGIKLGAERRFAVAAPQAA